MKSSIALVLLAALSSATIVDPNDVTHARRRPSLPIHDASFQSDQRRIDEHPQTTRYSTAITHHEFNGAEGLGGGLTVQDPPKGWPWSEMNQKPPREGREEKGEVKRQNVDIQKLIKERRQRSDPQNQMEAMTFVQNHFMKNTKTKRMGNHHEKRQSEGEGFGPSSGFFIGPRRPRTEMTHSVNEVVHQQNHSEETPSDKGVYSSQSFQMFHGGKIPGEGQNIFSETQVQLGTVKHSDENNNENNELKEKKKTRKEKPQQPATVNVGYTIGFVAPPDAAPHDLHHSGNVAPGHVLSVGSDEIIMGKPSGSHGNEEQHQHAHSQHNQQMYSVVHTPQYTVQAAPEQPEVQMQQQRPAEQEDAHVQYVHHYPMPQSGHEEQNVEYVQAHVPLVQYVFEEEQKPVYTEHSSKQGHFAKSHQNYQMLSHAEPHHHEYQKEKVEHSHGHTSHQNYQMLSHAEPQHHEYQRGKEDHSSAHQHYVMLSQGEPSHTHHYKPEQYKWKNVGGLEVATSIPVREEQQEPPKPEPPRQQPFLNVDYSKFHNQGPNPGQNQEYFYMPMVDSAPSQPFNVHSRPVENNIEALPQALPLVGNQYTTSSNFDHNKALTHSVGFDYSNAITAQGSGGHYNLGYEQNNLEGKYNFGVNMDGGNSPSSSGQKVVGSKIRFQGGKGKHIQHGGENQHFGQYSGSVQTVDLNGNFGLKDGLMIVQEPQRHTQNQPPFRIEIQDSGSSSGLGYALGEQIYAQEPQQNIFEFPKQKLEFSHNIPQNMPILTYEGISGNHLAGHQVLGNSDHDVNLHYHNYGQKYNPTAPFDAPTFKSVNGNKGIPVSSIPSSDYHNVGPHLFKPIVEPTGEQSNGNNVNYYGFEPGMNQVQQSFKGPKQSFVNHGFFGGYPKGQPSFLTHMSPPQLRRPPPRALHSKPPRPVKHPNYGMLYHEAMGPRAPKALPTPPTINHPFNRPIVLNGPNTLSHYHAVKNSLRDSVKHQYELGLPHVQYEGSPSTIHQETMSPSTFVYREREALRMRDTQSSPLLKKETDPVRAEKERVHQDMLRQQKELATYNSKLSVTMFKPTGKIPKHFITSMSEGKMVEFPITSSYTLDLKPPPVGK